MKHYIKNLRKNEKVQIIVYALGTCIICIFILMYLLGADISQAPTYIYSQF